MQGFEIWTGSAGRTTVTENRSSVQLFKSIKLVNFNLQRTVWTAVKPPGLQEWTRFYQLDNKYFEKKLQWSISFFFIESQSLTSCLAKMLHRHWIFLYFHWLLSFSFCQREDKFVFVKRYYGDRENPGE